MCSGGTTCLRRNVCANPSPPSSHPTNTTSTPPHPDEVYRRSSWSLLRFFFVRPFLDNLFSRITTCLLTFVNSRVDVTASTVSVTSPDPLPPYRILKERNDGNRIRVPAVFSGKVGSRVQDSVWGKWVGRYDQHCTGSTSTLCSQHCTQIDHKMKE